MPKNLLHQKQCIITTGEPIEFSYINEDNASKTAAFLTDGSNPTLDFQSEGWVKFHRGRNRTVEFDLENPAEISGFSATFLQDKSLGIYTPNSVEIYASTDNIDYSLIYSQKSKIRPYQNEKLLSIVELTNGECFTARYIRFVFNVEVFVCASSFMIFPASAGAKKDVKALPEPVAAAPEKGFKLASHKAMRNGVIVYCGYHNETMNYPESYTKNTAEQFLPYVAYVDSENEICDTMFESFYILSLMSRMPSGGCSTYDYRMTVQNTYKTDWEQFLDNMFLDGYNLNALEDAVEIVKNKLGIPDYTVNVHVQIPYPHISDADFGGGMRTDNLLARLEVCEWYINELITRFNAKSFINIKLYSIYQGVEAVPFAAGDEEEALFAGINDIAHKYGLATSWIPFYLATGFDKTEELGFDFACMQPNHMFRGTDKRMMGEFEETLRRHGLGAEIELNHTCVYAGENHKAEVERYFDYLRAGYKYGFMHYSNAFYQGAGIGYFYIASQSKNPLIRSIYDNTYLYIKGTLAPKIPKLSYTMNENNIFEFSIQKESVDDIFNGDIQLHIVKKPKHGTAVIENDIVRYIPNMSFNGFDIMQIVAKNENFSSEVIEIKINTVKNAANAIMKNTIGKTVTAYQKINQMEKLLIAAGLIALVSAVVFSTVRKCKTKKK